MCRHIQIISDGSCDLTKEELTSLNVVVNPFNVSFDGETYLKENIDFSVREFYQKLVDNPKIFPKTSLPTTRSYFDIFVENAKKGNDIICICISTKLSGSYNSALTAATMCTERYPECKIKVIDSKLITCLQGLLVKEVCAMRDKNYDIDTIVKIANEIKETARIYFTVGNLDYLRHGGRIGKLSGLVGATLRIKPIIILEDGELHSKGLCFTRNQSLVKILKLTKMHFEESGTNANDYRFLLGYGYDIKEGETFHQKVKETLNRCDVEIAQIGTTIGVHSGPYPMGIAFIKKHDNI